MMLSSAEWQALSLSLQIACLATLLCLPLALALALALTRCNFWGKTLLDSLVHAPLVLPPVVVGYLLLLTFGSRGLLGPTFEQWLGWHFVFSTKGAVLSAAVMSLPLMVRAMRLSLQLMDQGLELAARSLGAGPWDVLRSITLPLMLPGILSGSILAFAASLGEFGATMTFAANIAGETRTLPLALYTAIQTPNGDAMALRLTLLAMGLAVLALSLSAWAERWLRQRLGTA